MASSSRPARMLVTVIMDILVVVAVIVALRLVVEFFGVLSSADWGQAVLRITQLIVIPFGIDPIVTPYAGVFSVDGVLTILVLLAAEWLLSIVRRQL